MLRPRFLSRRATVVLLFNGLLILLGCGPQNLAMFCLPFTDDKVPAEFKLASKDKEVTVAILSTFSKDDDHAPEVIPADTELAEKLAHKLRKRCLDNKEKLKIVPAAQVRNYLNKQGRSGTVLPIELGKQVKADFVLTLEINSLSLYEKQSYRQLYRGNAVINVKVFDIHQEEDQRLVFDRPYHSEYPGTRGPIEADGSDITQFRSLFLSKIADDLSRWFTAYPSDERFKLD